MQVSSTAAPLTAAARPLAAGEAASRNAQERGVASGGKAANPKANAQTGTRPMVEKTPAPKDASATASTDNAAPPKPVAVYAEIWVGGKKVGEVDANGGVSLPSIPAALQLSGGASGPALARLRSEEIARALGGEVRYTGQSAPTVNANASSGDPKVDRMRARINAMYGASLGG